MHKYIAEKNSSSLFKKMLSSLLAVSIVTTSFTCFVSAQTDDSAGENVSAEVQTETEKSSSGVISLEGFNKKNQYQEYYEQYKQYDVNLPEIKIPAKNTSKVIDTTVEVSDYEGKKDVLKWLGKGSIEWEIDVPQTGLYTLSMMYMPIEGKGRTINLALDIDGKSPFDEAKRLSLKRLYKDNLIKDASGDLQFEKDDKDNEILPSQSEVFKWLERPMYDSQGRFTKPFQYYLTKGKHTVKIVSEGEPFAIEYLKLANNIQYISYNDYAGGSEKSLPSKVADDYINVIDAEKCTYRNNTILHPIYDRSDPLTKPYNTTRIRYNTMGGANWDSPEQSITWTVNAPETGYYNIGLRYRQNYVRGANVSRRLYIDEKIPFAEAENVEFPYELAWQSGKIGQIGNKSKDKDKKPEAYKIYLTKGEHTITLENALGDWTDIYRRIDELVYQLNFIYRKIVLVTGAEPDTLRDYNVHKEIPGLMDMFAELEETIGNEKKTIDNISNSGKGGGESEILNQLRLQIQNFIKEPRAIPRRLKNFKDNISALASWMQSINKQPLEIDSIYLTSAAQKLPRTKANFAERIAHEVKGFVASFYQEYESFSAAADKQSVNVWVNNGRDQTQMLKNMIDNYYTPKSGIKVNLSLVAGADLISAIMAGKAPDISLNTAQGDPINLGVRGALKDLQDFPGFEEYKKQFMPATFRPFTFGEKVYAVPETQSFNMLFYRTDIFEELGIQPPKTWDEFYEIVPIVQNNNMTVALSDYGDMFTTFLLQSGRSYYRHEGAATEFDTPEAVSAFENVCKFYKMYSFPVQYDFANRFRTGEMPMGIAGYPTYTFFEAMAPEIRGLWKMTNIPGTRKADGTIDSTIAMGTSCCIMIKKDEKHQKYNSAWDFMKWWTSTEAQSKYAQEIEMLLGPLGRYSPANVAAFDSVPWSQDEAALIKSQWDRCTTIPEVPGGYYLGRMLGNAFLKVINKSSNPRETILKYNEDINKEIDRKRTEYKLPTEADIVAGTAAKEGK